MSEDGISAPNDGVHAGNPPATADDERLQAPWWLRGWRWVTRVTLLGYLWRAGAWGSMAIAVWMAAVLMLILPDLASGAGIPWDRLVRVGVAPIFILGITTASTLDYFLSHARLPKGVESFFFYISVILLLSAFGLLLCIPQDPHTLIGADVFRFEAALFSVASANAFILKAFVYNHEAVLERRIS